MNVIISTLICILGVVIYTKIFLNMSRARKIYKIGLEHGIKAAKHSYFEIKRYTIIDNPTNSEVCVQVFYSQDVISNIVENKND